MRPKNDIGLTDQQRRVVEDHAHLIPQVAGIVYSRMRYHRPGLSRDDVYSAAQLGLVLVAQKFPDSVDAAFFKACLFNATRWQVQLEYSKSKGYCSTSYDALPVTLPDARTGSLADPFIQMDENFLVFTTPEGDVWKLAHDSSLVGRNVLVIPRKVWDYLNHIYVKGEDIRDVARKYSTSVDAVRGQLANWSHRIRNNIKNEYVPA